MSGVIPRVFVLMLLSSVIEAGAASLPVRMVKSGDTCQLVRDGQPYFIRGAGGDDRWWQLLAATGGNSVRLWGADRLGEQLDLAQRTGLTVTAGIWLPQIRQSFDYNDARAVAAVREQVRQTVTRYKDHPALLIWALGNEMEEPQGSDNAVWNVIEALAKMVKEIDPDHPVMTVVAEIGGRKVTTFQKLCPSVDILGINSYGGVRSVGDRYRKLGGNKPYILTEFGPPGIWEIRKSAIGAYPEPTSAQKADIYRAAYEQAVLGQPGLCLGSYAFFWGRKQEVTDTWFSLLLADGTRLGAVDVLGELWTGRPPARRCPAIAIKVPPGSELSPPGAIVNAALELSGPADTALEVTWKLAREPARFGTGGDPEPEPSSYPEAILTADRRGAQVRLPTDGGLYRLSATARDGHGGGATANVAIRVDAPAAARESRRASLPLVIYSENEKPGVYTPSGWMGDTRSLRFDPACTTNPHSGNTCLRCEFTAGAGWGGIAWQHPANNWGQLEGGYDLTGARRLTFWARGGNGGETVDFKFGIIPRDKRYADSGSGALNRVVLTREWQRYELSVEKEDLSGIKTGFAWSLASAGQAVVFYLDDIQWE